MSTWDINLTFVKRKYSGVVSISKESYLLVLMDLPSGPIVDSLVLHNMTPKCNERVWWPREHFLRPQPQKTKQRGTKVSVPPQAKD